jgi:hypothetical protein
MRLHKNLSKKMPTDPERYSRRTLVSIRCSLLTWDNREWNHAGVQIFVFGFLLVSSYPKYGRNLLNVRIPVDVDRPFHLKLSTHSIRSCPPIPVEVVH